MINLDNLSLIRKNKILLEYQKIAADKILILMYSLYNIEPRSIRLYESEYDEKNAIIKIVYYVPEDIDIEIEIDDEKDIVVVVSTSEKVLEATILDIESDITDLYKKYIRYEEYESLFQKIKRIIKGCFQRKS